MKKTKWLRLRLKEPKIIVMPGTYNAFIAKQIEDAGFEGIYVSGAGLSNSNGVPDTGILTLGDFVYTARWITRAVNVPVICDADTGFNDIEETVERYIKAGLAGMHIEDQVFPKRCGHLNGKEVIPCDEMVKKLRRAVKARDKYDLDFLIIVRTDSRGATNIKESQQLKESIQRGKAYLESGADMTFPESLRSKEEFFRYKEEVGGLLFANMTEYGKTPFISYKEFEELGYNIVIFPVTILRYLAGKVKNVLKTLKVEGNQKSLIRYMMTRTEINKLLNYETTDLT